jgi:hypothetical protein
VYQVATKGIMRELIHTAEGAYNLCYELLCVRKPNDKIASVTTELAHIDLSSLVDP